MMPTEDLIVRLVRKVASLEDEVEELRKTSEDWRQRHSEMRTTFESIAKVLDWTGPWYELAGVVENRLIPLPPPALKKAGEEKEYAT